MPDIKSKFLEELGSLPSYRSNLIINTVVVIKDC